MSRVAFIGLGRMGHGMAGRYLEAGFKVAVWNRSKAKAEDLIARGAQWATSPEDAAIDADAVITMVADDEASRAVWLTKDGAAANMKAGTLAIECSTVSHRHALDMARELKSRGLIYIDCPVTGLPEAAAAGKLTLLVGADAADLEKARPYLAPLCSTIRHFGAVGSRSEEHTSELQSHVNLVCRLLLEKKKHDSGLTLITLEKEVIGRARMHEIYR